MGELVADCPRCGSKKITFEIGSQVKLSGQYDIEDKYEVFCVCRHCRRSTVFKVTPQGVGDAHILSDNPMVDLGSINRFVDITGFVSTIDIGTAIPPDHLPEKINAAFNEGAICLAVGCYNASGAMFRLCVDLATKERLPKADEDGLNSKIRRSLGFRLKWLFERELLPKDLEELSSCIKEDGNDGAHDGTLQKPDAQDLLDFTFELLERLYTDPERLRLSKARREARRGEGKASGEV
jgi:hypothetical protein